VLRAEAVEIRALRCFVGGSTVDGVDLDEGRAFASTGRCSDLSCDLIACSETKPLNKLLRNVNVVIRREVAGLTASDEAYAAPEHFEDSKGCFVTHETIVFCCGYFVTL
jgi:hypothetical protein